MKPSSYHKNVLKLQALPLEYSSLKEHQCTTFLTFGRTEVKAISKKVLHTTDFDTAQLQYSIQEGWKKLPLPSGWIDVIFEPGYFNIPLTNIFANLRIQILELKLNATKRNVWLIWGYGFFRGESEKSLAGTNERKCSLPHCEMNISISMPWLLRWLLCGASK